MKNINYRVTFLCSICFAVTTANLFGKNGVDSLKSDLEINFEKRDISFDSLSEKIKALELKANNYESLLSMQGAFYQVVITVLIFVLGFGGWKLIDIQIKKVKIDNDERVISLRSVLNVNLADVNYILGTHSYASEENFTAFMLCLSSAKYLHDSIAIYDNNKSIMDSIMDKKNKDVNILGLTGKLITNLGIVEEIFNKSILSGKFDKEIADNYASITMKFDSLISSSSSTIASHAKIISDSFVGYVRKKNLLNV